MLNIFYLYVHISCDVRTIALLSETQPLKCIDQYKKPMREVSAAFGREDETNWDIFTVVNAFNTFQTVKDGVLICNLYLAHEIFNNAGDDNDYDVLCLYSVYTNPEFRKQGYAKALIRYALNYYKNTKKLTNPMIALHINPADKMMNFNYAFYYALGFAKGAIVENCPTDYKYRYNKIEMMENVRVLVQNIDTNPDKGSYLAMFCPFDSLFPRMNVDMPSMINEGEWLRGKLEERRSNEA